MEKSSFQFSNPTLKRLEFDVHDDFVHHGQLNMEITVNVSIQRDMNEDETPGNSAYVLITLSVGSKDNSTPFYIEADEDAHFKWEDGAFNEEEVDNLLNQNAVALLISYLRPVIASLTAACPYPSYNLPYINLVPKCDN